MMKTKSLNYQVRSDLIATSHDNKIYHISNMRKESKGETRELRKSRGAVLKTM